MSAYITLDERNKRPAPAEAAERRFLVSRRTKVAVPAASPTPEIPAANSVGKSQRRPANRDEKLAQKLT